jgi:colicin import membrane protein
MTVATVVVRQEGAVPDAAAGGVIPSGTSFGTTAQAAGRAGAQAAREGAAEMVKWDGTIKGAGKSLQSLGQVFLSTAKSAQGLQGLRMMFGGIAQSAQGGTAAITGTVRVVRGLALAVKGLSLAKLGWIALIVAAIAALVSLVKGIIDAAVEARRLAKAIGEEQRQHALAVAAAVQHLQALQALSSVSLDALRKEIDAAREAYDKASAAIDRMHAANKRLAEAKTRRKLAELDSEEEAAVATAQRAGKSPDEIEGIRKDFRDRKAKVRYSAEQAGNKAEQDYQAGVAERTKAELEATRAERAKEMEARRKQENESIAQAGQARIAEGGAVDVALEGLSQDGVESDVGTLHSIVSPSTAAVAAAVNIRDQKRRRAARRQEYDAAADGKSGDKLSQGTGEELSLRKTRLESLAQTAKARGELHAENSQERKEYTSQSDAAAKAAEAIAKELARREKWQEFSDETERRRKEYETKETKLLAENQEATVASEVAAETQATAEARSKAEKARNQNEDDGKIAADAAAKRKEQEERDKRETVERHEREQAAALDWQNRVDAAMQSRAPTDSITRSGGKLAASSFNLEKDYAKRTAEGIDKVAKELVGLRQDAKDGKPAPSESYTG